MNFRRLVTLLIGMLMLFSSATYGVAETDDGVAELLKTWTEMYSETSSWQLLEVLPDGTKLPLPDADDISPEKALKIATQTLLLFLGEDANFLAHYKPSFVFTVMREWVLFFHTTDISLSRDEIYVIVDGKTGDVVEICRWPLGPVEENPVPKG